MTINLSKLDAVVADHLKIHGDFKVVVLADPKAKPRLRDRRPNPRTLHGRNKIVIEPGFAEWAQGGGIRSVSDLTEAVGTFTHFARDGKPLGRDRIVVMRNGRRVSGKTHLV